MTKKSTDNKTLYYCSACGDRRPATYNAHTRTMLSRCCGAEAFPNQITLWVMVHRSNYHGWERGGVYDTRLKARKAVTTWKNDYKKLSFGDEIKFEAKIIPVQVRW